MYMLKVTIAATNTPQCIIPAAVVPDSMHPFQAMLPQNNGSNTMYLGDAGVNATNGIKLPAANSIGSLTPVHNYGSVLEDFFVYGTSGDILNIMIFP